MSRSKESSSIPSSNLYHQVDQDMKRMNHSLPLGFDMLVPNQQMMPQQFMPSERISHIESTSVLRYPSGIPPPPYTFQHPTGHGHVANLPDPVSAMPPKESNHQEPSNFLDANANKFWTKIPPPLRTLKQKYSSSIILVFPNDISTFIESGDNPSSGPGHWKSENYVRLPHNSENTATQQSNQQRYINSVKKWDIIKVELAILAKFMSEKSLDMSQAGNQIHSSVRKYNSKAADFTFNLLNHQRVTPSLQSTFHKICNAALEMQYRFPNGIPILRKNQPKTLFFTQGQIRCTMANSFLCTFPKRLEVTGQELPDINFFKLFDGGARGESNPKIEKILCILNYFEKVGNLQGEGKLLSFERRELPPGLHPHWKKSKERMSRVTVDFHKRIEGALDKLQIDFANRFVGGGVIGNGMVMEEIRFAICPELIAAKLFTEALGSDEVVIITGCEQFSSYSGYGDSFAFKGPFIDPQDAVPDPYGRRKTQVAVMDAMYFRPNEIQRQFEKEFVHRELNKCFCAFRPRRQQHNITPIATGNWGCGAFHGNVELKFILQWMAASQAGRRELHYYTTGDKEQSESIMRMVKFLGRKGVRVGTLSEALKGYYLNEIKSPSYFKRPKTLFQYFDKHFK